MLTFVVGEIYMVVQGRSLLPFMAWIKVLGMIILNTFVYAALGYLLALCVRSESGWGGMLTIVGTLVGFVGAIYLPMSQLPESVGNVLKCLPVLHGAAMMRVVLTEAAVEETFLGLPEIVGEVFKEEMGVVILAEGNEVTLMSQILFLLAYGIIAIIIAAIISKRRKIRDR
jgi:multidrug/hemolysin transport system permease protein